MISPVCCGKKAKTAKRAGVAEDADDHRRAPAEALQRRAEDEHREDLRDLADAHDRHDPVAGDADAAAPCAVPRNTPVQLK